MIDRTQVSPVELAAEVERLFPGQVRFGPHDQMLYATDASIYQIQPIGVLVPGDTVQLAKMVEWGGRRKVAILPRGGGTSLAGQCTNHAVVIDHSANCRLVLGLDVAGRRCRVEPGIGLDELNRWLEAQGCGLFFAPDPATSAQASIGGCIGNNAAGARSIRYGRTSENIAGLDIILATGQRAHLGPGSGRSDLVAADLARQVAAIARQYAALIHERYPKTLRRNAGYALDLVLSQLEKGISEEDLDLTGLICGSEGTLAVVLAADLKLHPVARSKGLAIASFASVDAAIEAVGASVATGACAVELIDDVVLEAARGNAECRRYMDLLADVDGKPPRAVLYVEYQETGPIQEVTQRLADLQQALPGVAIRNYIDKNQLLRAWALRKAGEPLLHGLAGHRKPVTCVEDNAVPLENLVQFVAEFKKIVARHGTVAAYYAHASVGVLHVRPLLDLHDGADLDRLRGIAVEVADLAKQCGGVMSGEHGDGRIRGPLLERFYGSELMAAFAQIKAVFDPAGVLNPGIIVGAGPVASITQHLRVLSQEKPLRWPVEQTYFDYSDQEGFAGALEMCNGAGVCRKTSGGVMCPSYRATLDERHSTRGRGNALRLALSGQLADSGHPNWDDPDTLETLSLCLSCKACKSECPSNVDVARLKAEYLAQHYRRCGKPLAARVFGRIRQFNRLGSVLPGLANWLGKRWLVRMVANRVLGLAPQRHLPEFAPSLYRWFNRRRRPVDIARPRVVLFADCFTTYNQPHIGQAAVAVLERLGYAVELPKVGCCGRSMVSTGLLDEAIITADRNLALLATYVNKDAVKAIVVCEPSCLSMIKDEWLRLKLATSMDLRQQLADKTMAVEEFVERYWDAHPIAPQPADLSQTNPVLLHGHCHQKAMQAQEATAAILRRLVGSRLTVLPSGCCGMAGAFGYDRQHYPLSIKIARQSLFRYIETAEPASLLVAPGTSCRQQISDGLGRQSQHPVELLERMLG